MTAEMVRQWCDVGVDELAEAQASPAVQQADVMLSNLPSHCSLLNKVAKQLYTQWIIGLRLD